MAAVSKESRPKIFRERSQDRLPKNVFRFIYSIEVKRAVKRVEIYNKQQQEDGEEDSCGDRKESAGSGEKQGKVSASSSDVKEGSVADVKVAAVATEDIEQGNMSNVDVCLKSSLKRENSDVKKTKTVVINEDNAVKRSEDLGGGELFAEQQKAEVKKLKRQKRRKHLDIGTAVDDSSMKNNAKEKYESAVKSVIDDVDHVYIGGTFQTEREDTRVSVKFSEQDVLAASHPHRRLQSPPPPPTTGSREQSAEPVSARDVQLVGLAAETPRREQAPVVSSRDKQTTASRPRAAAATGKKVVSLRQQRRRENTLPALHLSNNDAAHKEQQTPRLLEASTSSTPRAAGEKLPTIREHAGGSKTAREPPPPPSLQKQNTVIPIVSRESPRVDTAAAGSDVLGQDTPLPPPGSAMVAAANCPPSPVQEIVRGLVSQSGRLRGVPQLRVDLTRSGRLNRPDVGLQQLPDIVDVVLMRRHLRLLRRLQAEAEEREVRRRQRALQDELDELDKVLLQKSKKRGTSREQDVRRKQILAELEELEPKKDKKRGISKDSESKHERGRSTESRNGQSRETLESRSGRHGESESRNGRGRSRGRNMESRSIARTSARRVRSSRAIRSAPHSRSSKSSTPHSRQSRTRLPSLVPQENNGEEEEVAKEAKQGEDQIKSLQSAQKVSKNLIKIRQGGRYHGVSEKQKMAGYLARLQINLCKNATLLDMFAKYKRDG